jgi:polysaccharide transporter, PST family
MAHPQEGEASQVIWTPRKFFSHGLVQNVIALYGVQACTYLLPVLTFPYLARVLGPSGWGSVVFAQLTGSIIALFVEYGFDISASRETSRQRDEPRQLAKLISGVLGAKGLLAVLAVCGALIFREVTHHVATSNLLFWTGTTWGVFQGINMLWYFQGLERMRLASVLEISGKVVATLSIFVLVRRPADGWKVMAAQCIGCAVAHGVTVVLAYREVGFAWPTPKSVWQALRMGWSMFLFRAAQGMSGSVNGLVLGSVTSLTALGEYAGAERLSRVFQQGMWPVNQALYPRLTHQMENNTGDAMKTVRLSIIFLGGLGLLFGLILFLTAPLLVRLVLGPAFVNSLPALRVFALWIPLVALSTVMIFQLLLPNGLDYQFNLVTVVASLIGIGCSVFLAPRLGAAGIAWSTVVSQLFTVIAFAFIARGAGLNPFRRSLEPAPAVNLT